MKETGEPKRLAALVVDVSDPKSIDAAAETLEREYAGKLGGLINNAGVRAAVGRPAVSSPHVLPSADMRCNSCPCSSCHACFTQCVTCAVHDGHKHTRRRREKCSCRC